jgi:hypothetical protein
VHASKSLFKKTIQKLIQNDQKSAQEILFMIQAFKYNINDIFTTKKT